MTKSILVARGLTGFLWLVQLVLGTVFWTGHAMGLVQLHMAVGTLFVVALITLAVLCARAGAPVAPAAALVVLGVLIAAVGMVQVQLLPGEYHWVVRVVHLLLGVAAMPMAGRLSMAARGPRPASPERLLA